MRQHLYWNQFVTRATGPANLNFPVTKGHPILWFFTKLHPLPTSSYFAVVDCCSCPHDALQAVRRFMQLCVQEAERSRSRPPCQHLLLHIVYCHSHWLEQSLSWNFKVEQLKVKTLSKKIKIIKPHCFLFNVRSFHLGPWLPVRSHQCRSVI